MSADLDHVTEREPLIHPIRRTTRQRVPIWAATLLWVLGAAVCGFAIGWNAEVTVVALVGAVALTFLLGYVELAAAALVVASCFEDYLSTVSSVSVKALAVVLVGAWVIQRTRGPLGRGRPGPMVFAVVALTVVLFVSTIVHGGGSGAAGSLARWAGFLAVLVVLADCLRSRISVEWLARVYVSACGVAAFCGLLAYARGAVRVGGPIGDPNDFAVFLLAALPLSVAVRRVGRRRWVWDLASVLIVVAIAGTLSRGAVVGLVAMLVFAVVTRQITRNALVGILGVLLTVAGFAASIFPDEIRRSLTQKSAVADQNVSERLYLWHSAEQMTLHSPLVGQGPGSFGTEHREFVDRLPLSVDHLLDVAHNTYLEIAAELGILGLLAFLAILVIGFRGAWSVWRRDATPVAAGVTSAFVGVAVAAMFLSEQFYLPFWLLAALGAGLAGRAPAPTAPSPVDVGVKP